MDGVTEDIRGNDHMIFVCLLIVYRETTTLDGFEIVRSAPAPKVVHQHINDVLAEPATLCEDLVFKRIWLQASQSYFQR